MCPNAYLSYMCFLDREINQSFNLWEKYGDSWSIVQQLSWKIEERHIDAKLKHILAYEQVWSDFTPIDFLNFLKGYGIK